MVALLEYSEKGAPRRVLLEDARALGMDAVRVRLPQSARFRRDRFLREAAEVMSRLGVRTVCFEARFDRCDFFIDRGFREPDTRRLFALKAADVLCAAGVTGAVAVISPIADAEAMAAINRVCSRFRRLMVDVGAETGRICAEIRRRTGASVIERPAGAVLMRAEGAIVFRGSEAVRFSDRCAVFCEDGEMREKIKGGKVVERVTFGAYTAPEGYDIAELLAAAVEAGRLDVDKLSVSEVGFKTDILRDDTKNGKKEIN